MSGNEELIVNTERIMPSFTTEQAPLITAPFTKIPCQALGDTLALPKSEDFMFSTNFTNITDPQLGKVGIIQSKSDHLFMTCLRPIHTVLQ